MTDWENRYQSGDMPWEKGRAAPPLLELLEKTDPELWGKGPVLVPGCGLGHDVRVISGSLGIPVVGLDLSVTALELAEKNPKVGSETFEIGNFLEPSWQEGRMFSAIWEHTCFCAIDPSDRDRYASAAAAVLPEGGLLAGVFFLTPHDPGEEGKGPPFATSIEELKMRFSPWFEQVDGWMPGTAYPGREGREWIGLFRRVVKA